MIEYCVFCGEEVRPVDCFLCKTCRWKDNFMTMIYILGCVVILTSAFLIAMAGPNLIMDWLPLN